MSLLALCGASSARAQAPCSDAALDTFQSARRSRRILQDHSTIKAATDWEAQRDYEARVMLHKSSPTWTFRSYVVGDTNLWTSPKPLCTRAGAQEASLLSTRVGLSVSVTHELHRAGIQLFTSTGYDTLEIASDTPSKQSAESSQSLYGVRLQPWRWTQVTLGAILDDPLVVVPADPTKLVIDTSRFGRPDPTPRYYVSVGVPALYDASLDLVLSSQDKGVQTLFMNLRDVSIAAAPWIRPSAGLSRLADEGRWVGMLGARLVWTDLVEALWARRKLEGSLLLEGSVEWPHRRLRHGRARLEVERRISELSGGDIDLLDMGAYLDWTLYDSAWLETHSAAGAGSAQGFGLYGWLRWAERPWNLTLEFGGGQNRPETLAQLSELRQAPEYRTMFLIQFTR